MFIEHNKKQYIFNIFYNFCIRNNYKFIELPIINNINIYKHNVGEFSEIITKQMFSVTYLNSCHLHNKNNEDKLIKILRPEVTSQVIDFFKKNEHKLAYKKYGYFCKNFRYEREQKYRKREFFQMGIEIINHKMIDVLTSISNCINLLQYFLEDSDLKKIIVKLNNIGNIEDRIKYSNYISNTINFEELSLNGKQTIKNNTLRILDTKDENDKKIINKLKGINDFLLKTQNDEIKNIETTLNTIYKEINFQIDEKMVRGLDYYNNNIFEIIIDKIAICGGGEYQIKKDQNTINGVGWAIGVDRLELFLKDYHIQENIVDILIMINKDFCISDFIFINKVKNNIALKNKKNVIQICSFKSSISKLKKQFSYLIFNFFQKGNEISFQIYISKEKKTYTLNMQELEKFNFII